MRWGKRRGIVPAMTRPSLVVALLAIAACGGPKQPTPKPPDPGLGSDAAKPDDQVKLPPTPPADPPLALWPEVKKGTLPNGLTYYIHKNKKPDKRVMLWLAVNSGSVQEDDDQRGLAESVATEPTQKGRMGWRDRDDGVFGLDRGQRGQEKAPLRDRCLRH